MRIFSQLLTCLLALALPVPVLAALSLTAPNAVGKGNAFVARAESDKATQEFAFTWLGKTHKVKAATNGSIWDAEMLLPVPLGVKETSGKLRVSALGAGQPVETKVAFREVQRPTQKLQVDKKFVEPPREVRERINRDREKVRQALAQGNLQRQWQLPLYRPVDGGISSLFGLRRVFNGQLRGEHRGLDLRGPTGTPIRACADGLVALNDDLYYSGNTVYLNHGDGVFTAYLHMSRSNVRQGQKVKRGDVIGYVGATGRVTGPHLHLSLLTQGQAVDPLPLLERRGHGGQNAAR